VTITAEPIRQGSRMLADEGFREYVVADGSRLLRMAYLLVGDREEAEDLVQLCLVRMWRRWARIDTPHAYAQQILTRLVTDGWRRRLRRPHTVPLADHDRLDDRDPYADVEGRHAVVDGLRSLPARQRAVLVLRYFEQLSEPETAAVLGISVGSVKTHNARGLARLRGLLASTPEGHER
jgi:RNA polymerase sigma-70 factor (sigma-E family)